jgi:hypothetical protein
MLPQRNRPDIEHTREALREHDERTEEPPELPQPPGSDAPEPDEEDED